jgi:hypothetical protein
VPDDDIVLAYVGRGALSRYVEAVASENAAFAEELVACIDALEEAGETVDERARAWRANARPAAATVVTLERGAKSRVTTLALVAVAASVLLAGLGGGYAFHSSATEQARITALKDEEIRAKEAALSKLLADLKAQNDAVAMAQADAANAKSDADRLAAQAKLAQAQESARNTQASIAAVRTGGQAKAGAGGKSPRPACTCQAGDPLCSCL